MSDKIGSRQIWPWQTGGTAGIAGVTAEEIKVQKAVVGKDPQVQPIPETRSTEFLTPSTSSEHLRLSPPAAANPLVTPTGPQHDHLMVRAALDKARGATAQELHKFLQGPEAVALPEDRRAQMRTSLAREQALMTLMRGVQEMQEGIYARVIGTAEA